MMKKAKTYLASIQAAATERELTGIELMFKQDMCLQCRVTGKVYLCVEKQPSGIFHFHGRRKNMGLWLGKRRFPGQDGVAAGEHSAGAG